MKKSIVLCADDYGQAPAISQGILALVQNRRLSAVSCMVTSPYWNDHANWLLNFQSQIDIGLHFNLTAGKSPLSWLMLRALTRQLNKKSIVNELNKQVDLFTAARGGIPDFIDGHQHIHQFPIIREALLQVYEQRFTDKKPYIRLINGKLKRTDWILDFKKHVTQAMGTTSLKRDLEKYHIPHNQYFSGMYSFVSAKNYAKFFPTFLKEVGDNGLIMCHPGLASMESNDLIAAARYYEYQYLSSNQFLADCETHGVLIERFAASRRPD